MRYLLYSILLSIVFSSTNAVNTTEVLVTIPQGTMKGFRIEYGWNKTELFYGAGTVFLGIPFVEPPVGPLRFQKPKPLCTLPGTGAYDATFYRPICPQDGGNVTDMSEDCLYLNVFTPEMNPKMKYPVMLWIHGGSMRGGSAQEFNYKGAIRNFVSRGVVVVTIQYRLGLLGFFTSYTDDFPPNLGMLDQVEAIRWVSNNIQYFGGDPKRITLFGQSAGSASVSAHTYSPLSQNLFQKAIMESGVATTCFEGSLGFTNMSFRRAQKLCNTTAAQWAANDFNSTKQCLMKADYHTFLPLERDFQDVMGWKMSQDNYFMPGIPSTLAANRPNIPVMIGSMQNEYSLFDLDFLSSGVPLTYYTQQGFETEYAVFAGFIANEENHVIEIMENVYTPPGTAANDNVAWLKINDKALTCTGFTGFIGAEIDNYLSNGNGQVYLYEMTYSPNVGRPSYRVPGWSPVPHAAEIPYVWVQEKHWNAAIKKNEVTRLDYALLDWFADTWVNFAKMGWPRSLSEWPPLSQREVLNYYEINVLNNTMKKNYRMIDQTVWNKVIPVLAGPLPPYRPDYNNGSTFEQIREEYQQSAVNVCEITSSPTSITTRSTSNTTAAQGSSTSPSSNASTTVLPRSTATLPTSTSKVPTSTLSTSTKTASQLLNFFNTLLCLCLCYSLLPLA